MFGDATLLISSVGRAQLGSRVTGAVDGPRRSRPARSVQPAWAEPGAFAETAVCVSTEVSASLGAPQRPVIR